MTHHAFKPASDGPVELEADFVVVGSGAGGATVAVGLARGGRSVVVVEAGAWRDPDDYPSSSTGALRDMMDDWGTTLARGRAFWPIVQASAVGGTTVINSAICVRTPADIFELWKNEHGIGGKEMADAVWRYQDQVEQELFVEEVPKGSLGRSNELALLGAGRVGYDSHVMRRYVKGCEGAGQCLQGCRRNRKQSTNLNYIPEVMTRGGTILSCAPVDRVRFEKNRAIGVEGRFRHPRDRRRGAPFFVRAKKAVVIAASATHSPALLLRSKVKNRALGKHFQAHPGTGAFGVYDDPVDMNIGATQGWASMAFREDPGLKLETLALPPEMIAGRLSGGGTELMKRLTDLRHFAFWVHAVRAETHGSVKNGFGNRPVVHYGMNARDMERLRKGVHLVAKTHVAAGAKSIVTSIFGMPYALAPNEIDKILEGPLDPRCYIAILSHLFGGCVMGPDASRAVCDERGRVYGYEGLVIADASQIPTTLGVNPQHTIMGLAHLRAEQLLG